MFLRVSSSITYLKSFTLVVECPYFVETNGIMALFVAFRNKAPKVAVAYICCHVLSNILLVTVQLE